MIDEELLKSIINNPHEISNFHFDEILPIIDELKTILQDENILVELNIKDATMKTLVIGDIHGNLDTLLVLKKLIENNKPEHVIFLGDIVDRGPYQLECLILVSCLKILEPKRFYLLRGNHETLEMNQTYGFFSNFIQKFTNFDDFNEIISFYELLPTCLKINDKILCLHGGIPNDLNILNKIKGLKSRDTNKEINNSLYQMMWNDPKETIAGFSPSFRGPGIFFFGSDVFNEFMKANDLAYIIRAHEFFIEGFKWFFNQKLLSIFSSANYWGKSYPNPASYAIIKNEDIFPKNIIIT